MNLKQILRNVLAIVIGLFVGSIVNMALINLNGIIIPLPDGADFSNSEKLKESMRLLEPIHFIFPFLGHALGTFVGALVAYIIAATHKFNIALSIGIFFLAGGIYMVYSVGGPLWFQAADILLAYIPMALLAVKVARVILKKA